MNHVITQTDDGSATLYLPELDEHYHSVKGARAESLHVYLHLGLHHALQRLAGQPLRVFEVGLGTGLNALLTMEEAGRLRVPVRYVAAELYPLAWEEVSRLAYSDSAQFRAIHEAPWGEEVALTPYFTLCKLRGDVRSMPVPASDVVYFDAFAPEKQPELWAEDFLCALQAALPSGAVLTTYCAKGEVRRRLQRAGFRVERLPGPPSGKREVLRAVKE